MSGMYVYDKKMANKCFYFGNCLFFMSTRGDFMFRIVIIIKKLNIKV